MAAAADDDDDDITGYAVTRTDPTATDIACSTAIDRRPGVEALRADLTDRPSDRSRR